MDPVFADEPGGEPAGALRMLVSLTLLRCGDDSHRRRLVLAGGSVLDFTGDAFVNAANEGCTGGFGVDEMVNQSGGAELKEARKKLGGCKTGDAKTTPSFAHTKTAWIVHAVGPVYRINSHKLGFDESDPRALVHMRSLDPLLVQAYRAVVREARADEHAARRHERHDAGQRGRARVGGA